MKKFEVKTTDGEYYTVEAERYDEIADTNGLLAFYANTPDGYIDKTVISFPTYNVIYWKEIG